MPILPSPQTHKMYQRKLNFHFFLWPELVSSGEETVAQHAPLDTLSGKRCTLPYLGGTSSPVRLPTHMGFNSLTYARNLK